MRPSLHVGRGVHRRGTPKVIARSLAKEAIWGKQHAAELADVRRECPTIDDFPTPHVFSAPFCTFIVFERGGSRRWGGGNRSGGFSLFPRARPPAFSGESRSFLTKITHPRRTITRSSLESTLSVPTHAPFLVACSSPRGASISHRHAPSLRAGWRSRGC